MPERLARRCSECGKSLADKGPLAVTCTDTCRSARSRRMRRLNVDDGGAAREIRDIAGGRVVQDVAREVMKEELRPVVREALTEEALRGVQDLLALTPAAVAALSADLEGDDANLRQRAATTVVKYTMGHPALVRSGDADGSKQIVVNFALPRPPDGGGDGPSAIEEESVTDGEAEELRICDACGEEKLATQFVGGSLRCVACQAALSQKVMARVEAVR